MKKLFSFFFVFYLFSFYSQNKPKLVVGIVVDQMRYDYFYRFWDKFGNDGFKKLVKEGFFFRNTHFNYTPTYTGPGHASIYTGTTPSVHGIIANNWYDKISTNTVYCAGDTTMATICDCKAHRTPSNNSGKMSPHRMLTTTFCDELKLFQPNAKVFGISLKDRGAILPSGHSSDGAFWMDDKAEWISSSYYFKELPKWLTTFQSKHSPLNNNNLKWIGEGVNYNLSDLIKINGPSVIKTTPIGNTYLKNLAIELLKKEKLGMDSITDILTLSFSSTDYIGHKYGPHSNEIIDTYIKLDKDLADFLNFIEKSYGKENALVFLTADHGVVSVPNELIKRNIPAGYFNGANLLTEINGLLNKQFESDEDLALSYSNQQLFLNRKYISKHHLKLKDIQESAANYILTKEGVMNTYTAYQLHHYEYENGFHSLIQNGFHQKRSGDVIVNYNPGWIQWDSETGTTHGSCFSYDTHVPLLFWGANIKNDHSDEKVEIIDVAPSICLLLGISFPNGCTGKPLKKITE